MTPGKPNAPVETVTVSVEKGQCVLTATRQHPEGDVLSSGTAALSQAEADDVWRLIENHLTSFEPLTNHSAAPGFGERHIHVTKGRQSIVEATWDRPLQNGSGLRALESRLAQLAKTSVRGVSLYYLRTD